MVGAVGAMDGKVVGKVDGKVVGREVTSPISKKVTPVIQKELYLYYVMPIAAIGWYLIHNCLD